MFAQVVKRQSQDGIQLWLIGMNPGVLAVVQRSPLGQILRREGMHFNLEIAVGRYLRDELTRELSMSARDDSEGKPREVCQSTPNTGPIMVQ